MIIYVATYKIIAKGTRKDTCSHKEHTNITLADLQGVGTENLMYLEEYDAYYLTTSDFGAGIFTCKWGEIIEDTVYLYSQSGVRLALRNQQGEYKIVAHQIMES